MNLKQITATVLLMLLTSAQPVWAQSGGSEGPAGSGGGHELEARFKAKAQALFIDLTMWDPAAQAVLKFPIYDILAALSQPGNVKPLCADPATVAFMKSKNKYKIRYYDSY